MDVWCDVDFSIVLLNFVGSMEYIFMYSTLHQRYSLCVCCMYVHRIGNEYVVLANPDLGARRVSFVASQQCEKCLPEPDKRGSCDKKAIVEHLKQHPVFGCVSRCVLKAPRIHNA